MKNQDLFENSAVIIGAGAGGMAAAKLFVSSKCQTYLYERHSEPGGSAGYFSRGVPRRTFAVGATQLVECLNGGLQFQIFSLGSQEAKKDLLDHFIKIPEIRYHWPQRDLSVCLTQTGCLSVTNVDSSAQDGVSEQVSKLQKILDYAAQDANWMWDLLSQVPRFPFQSLSDIIRALRLVRFVPAKRLLILPFLFFSSVETVCKFRFGTRKSDWLVWDFLNGLLLDTSQNDCKRTPWLAGVMGLTLVPRGLAAFRGSPRSFFRKQLSDLVSSGLNYHSKTELISVRTVPQGFEIELQRGPEKTRRLVTDNLILNTTIWDLTERLFLPKDLSRNTRVFRRWEKIAKQETGWGAFAIYGLIQDHNSFPDWPWFHQIFPLPTEPELCQSGLYVSIAGRNDSSSPNGYRTLTATLHMKPKSLTEQERAETSVALQTRIEKTLNVKLEFVETATPETYGRYISRTRGQVGGFALSFQNFLFRSTPSLLVHPNKKTKLLLVGDTVFPGQGVIACTVSGVIAWERATRKDFRKQWPHLNQ